MFTIANGGCILKIKNIINIDIIEVLSYELMTFSCNYALSTWKMWQTLITSEDIPCSYFDKKTKIKTFDDYENKIWCAMKLWTNNYITRFETLECVKNNLVSEKKLITSHLSLVNFAKYRRIWIRSFCHLLKKLYINSIGIGCDIQKYRIFLNDSANLSIELHIEEIENF